MKLYVCLICFAYSLAGLPAQAANGRWPFPTYKSISPSSKLCQDKSQFNEAYNNKLSELDRIWLDDYTHDCHVVEEFFIITLEDFKQFNSSNAEECRHQGIQEGLRDFFLQIRQYCSAFI